MSKNKKIIIVGLPLFAKRVKEGLDKVDPFNQYIVLDTYYSWFDKIKVPFAVLGADVVYSINGTISNSKVLNLAFRLGKKVVMHWVGSDVVTARKQYLDGNFKKKYFEAVHLTVAPWLRNELKDVGINAEVQSISGYEPAKEVVPLPESFNVLTYIPENRADYYGLQAIIELAKGLPKIDIHVIGSERNNRDFPSNLIFHGWVDEVGSYVDKSVVTIRFVEHDGLSQFVLESLSKGRYVLYNNPLKGSFFTTDVNAMRGKIIELSSQFNKNKLGINDKGRSFIFNEFNFEDVMNDLKDHLLQ